MTWNGKFSDGFFWGILLYLKGLLKFYVKPNNSVLY